MPCTIASACAAPNHALAFAGRSHPPAVPPTAVRAAPTEEQVAQIKLAIGAASSLEEVQKLERALKAGDYATIAKAAEAAKAAQAADAGAAEN